MSEYSSDQIQVLKGLEGVRKRPGMYMGGTDGAGLLHMLWELVGNVVDLHLASNATELRIELGPDSWITVRDDGPGIPTDLLPRARDDDDEPRTVLEEILLRMHCGATYDGHYPHAHVAGSLHGVGLAAVNALSERFEVETTYHGVRWSQAFERGERASTLRRHGPATIEGTTIRFRPDPTIFSTLEIDHEAARARLQELAWLNPMLRVFFQEVRLPARGGITGWARQIAGARGEIVAMHSLSQQIDDVHVDLALVWNSGGETVVRSFVNMQPIGYGPHVNSLWLGFTDHARAVSSPAYKASHVRERLAPGLVAMINLWLHGPEFASPTRDHLRSPRADKAIHLALRRSLDSNGCTWRVRSFLAERLMVPAPT